VAVLCHELPHEIGDFAMLLKTGMSVKTAIFYNLVSTVLSVIGMLVGLHLGSIDATATAWLFAATAGIFLYVALVDMMPELNSGTVIHAKFGRRAHLRCGMPRSAVRYLLR
jgi:solute carrier family 39 (zinc transporter), member 10